MKKIAATVLVFFGLSAAYALPIGNPNEACLYQRALWRKTGCSPYCPVFSWFEGWNVRAGFYGDYVFNRNFKAGDDERTKGRHLEKTEIFTNAAYLVVNFNNFCTSLDIFGTIGASDFHTRQDITAFTEGELTSRETDLWFSSALSWSVGARTALWNWKCFTIGFEGQFFTASPLIDRFVPFVGSPITHFRRKFSRYNEWQVAFGLSYTIETSCPSLAFVPYAGVKYCRAKWTLGDALIPDTTRRFGHLHAKKHWGWALGTTFTLCQLIGITVEGRFADEKAIHVNGQVRF